MRDSIARACAYVESGADGFFVPGITAPSQIAELVDAVSAPLNTMAVPGAPSVRELERLGVRRVSLGTGLTQHAMTLLRTSTARFLDSGGIEPLPDTLTFAEANGMFIRRTLEQDATHLALGIASAY